MFGMREVADKDEFYGALTVSPPFRVNRAFNVCGLMLAGIVRTEPSIMPTVIKLFSVRNTCMFSSGLTSPGFVQGTEASSVLSIKQIVLLVPSVISLNPMFLTLSWIRSGPSVVDKRCSLAWYWHKDVEKHPACVPVV